MRNPLTAWIVTAVVFLCFIEPTSAQKQDEMRISLRQAIEMALANNKDIELARQNALMADWDLKTVFSQYEAHSTFNSSYEHTKVPINSFLSGGVNGSVIQSDLMAGYRLEGLTPQGGGNYHIDFATRRFTTNNIFAALNPQYPSDLSVHFNQPLVRGRIFPARIKDIEIAKKNQQLTDTEFRKIATETIVNVKRAYWDLVFARNDVTIQGEVLRDTRNQLDLNKRRAATGVLAVSDVSRWDARAAESEQIAYRATENVTRTENTLKNLIAENASSDLWDASLIPTDVLDSDAMTVTLQQAVAAALETRLELRETEIAAEINAIEQRYFSDQSRSQVDLVSSYGVAGLGGTTNKLIQSLAPTAVPPFLQGAYGQALTNLIENRFNNFSVGVQINLPLHNHEAEAKLARAVVENQRVNTQREKLRQLIQVDVRNAYQSVSVAESQTQAASVVRIALESQRESEQRRSNVGYSTTDVVLERQISLAAARLSEMRAQAEHKKALADLERAMGTALQSNGISIQSH
jgi:HAE1 family hydrophobic/amphiphilic exporter-1